MYLFLKRVKIKEVDIIALENANDSQSSRIILPSFPFLLKYTNEHITAKCYETHFRYLSMLQTIDAMCSLSDGSRVCIRLTVAEQVKNQLSNAFTIYSTYILYQKSCF